MTWRTHVAVGANALWIMPLFGPLGQSVLVLLPVAILASLLPDIDAASAKIHYAGGGVLRIFRGAFYGKYFHHRGLMHSLFVTLILFTILVIIFGRTLPALPFVFALAYFSHPLIDGFNSSVGYLYPFTNKRFALVPRSLRTPVKGMADNLFFFLALLGILMFFFAFQNQFLPSTFNFGTNPSLY